MNRNSLNRSLSHSPPPNNHYILSYFLKTFTSKPSFSNSLQSHYTSLQSQTTSLQSPFLPLQSEITSLQSPSLSLQSENTSLQSPSLSLQSAFRSLQSHYTSLQSPSSSLQSKTNHYNLVPYRYNDLTNRYNLKPDDYNLRFGLPLKNNCYIELLCQCSVAPSHRFSSTAARIPSGLHDLWRSSDANENNFSDIQKYSPQKYFTTNYLYEWRCLFNPHSPFRIPNSAFRQTSFYIRHKTKTERWMLLPLFRI
jgi:hypothetical protein